MGKLSPTSGLFLRDYGDSSPEAHGCLLCEKTCRQKLSRQVVVSYGLFLRLFPTRDDDGSFYGTI